MSMEYLTVRNELLVFAADEETGIYLVNGADGAWLTDQIYADSDIHWEAERLLGNIKTATAPGASWTSVVLHSMSTTAPHVAWTSWHPRGTSQVNTYIAVLAVDGYVKDAFPGAAPVSLELAQAYGKPLPHGAAEVPLPRDLDVIFHALSHLKWLMQRNGPVIKDMTEAGIFDLFRRHLEPLEEWMARMYYEPDVSVA